MRRLFLFAALWIAATEPMRTGDRKRDLRLCRAGCRHAAAGPLCAPLARQPGETLPDVPFRRRLYDRNAGQPAFPPLLRLLRPQGFRRRFDRLPAGDEAGQTGRPARRGAFHAGVGHDAFDGDGGPLRRHGLYLRTHVGCRSRPNRDVRVERRGHHGADGRVLALQRASADPREVHADL